MNGWGQSLLAAGDGPRFPNALEVEGGRFYAPIYMMMFLEQKRLPETMVCDIGDPLDFS